MGALGTEPKHLPPGEDPYSSRGGHGLVASSTKLAAYSRGLSRADANLIHRSPWGTTRAPITAKHQASTTQNSLVTLPPMTDGTCNAETPP